MMPRLAPAVALLACLAPVPAQLNQLQINEVNYATNDQWIEVANFSATDADLTNWSIYQATLTSGRPGNYWWPFPAGTRVPGNGVIRVRWLHPIDTGNTNPRVIDTGDTVFHFLFGLFAEPLARDSGSLALVDSQSNLDMNTFTRYRDWLSWGTTTTPFPRENLAAQNNRWPLMARIPPAGLNQSTAFLSFDLNEPSRPDMFFRDASPTIDSINHEGEARATFGTACIEGGLNQPSRLTLESWPVLGNVDFGITVDELSPGQSLMGLVLGIPAPAGFPWVRPPCSIYVNPTLPFIALGFAASQATFTFRPTLTQAVAGARVGLQWIAANPSGLSFSNGGDITIGRR